MRLVIFKYYLTPRLQETVEQCEVFYFTLWNILIGWLYNIQIVTKNLNCSKNFGGNNFITWPLDEMYSGQPFAILQRFIFYWRHIVEYGFLHWLPLSYKAQGLQLYFRRSNTEYFARLSTLGYGIIDILLCSRQYKVISRQY